jgi:hypothetical protein
MANVTETTRKGFLVKVNGEDIRVHLIENDISGNPRYVVHFLSLGIINKEDYGRIAGLTKYRANWFGGGYVFTSYNLEQDLKYLLKVVSDYYINK